MSFSFSLVLMAAVGMGQSERLADPPLSVPAHIWKKLWQEKVAARTSLPIENAFSAIRYAGNQKIYYHFNIAVQEADPVSDGLAGWKLVFKPGFGFPRQHSKDCELFGSWSSGWPQKVQFRRKWLNELTIADKAVQSLGEEAAFFAEPVDFFPVEFFPLYAEREIRSGAESLRIRTQDLGKHYLAELTQTARGVEVLRVRQKWEKGEKWWQEYDRWDHGKKTLNVWRAFEFSDGTQLPDDYEFRQEGIDPNNYHPISLDARLQLKVDFRRKRPTLDDLFQLALEKTGVRLSRHPDLPSDCNPYLGDIQLENYPLWGVMEVVATLGFENGIWEADGEGYRLKGTPKPLPDWLEKQNRSTRGLWLVVIVIALGLAIAGAYCWRRRQKKATT